MTYSQCLRISSYKLINVNKGGNLRLALLVFVADIRLQPLGKVNYSVSDFITENYFLTRSDSRELTVLGYDRFIVHTYTGDALHYAKYKKCLWSPAGRSWHHQGEEALEKIPKNEGSSATPAVTYPASHGLAGEKAVEKAAQYTPLLRFAPMELALSVIGIL